MGKNDLDKKLDLSSYEDPSGGISTSKLNIGLWIVSHRRQFILGVIAFLVVLSVALYSYSIYNYIDYLFFGGKQERAAIEDLAEMPAVVGKASTTPIVVLTADVFLNNKKYDFLGKVSNPNPNFFAEVSYCFVSGTVDLACGSTGIFPGETKSVSALAKSFSSRPLGVSLVIKSTGWQRVNAHSYPDWPKFASDHLNFVVSSSTFKESSASGLSEKNEIDLLEFNVTNKTAYNYWEVPFNIILSANGKPVAVNRYAVGKLISGETRNVKISWANNIPQPDDISITPDLDITDESVYMKY
jgi:hypothetical protein